MIEALDRLPEGWYVSIHRLDDGYGVDVHMPTPTGSVIGKAGNADPELALELAVSRAMHTRTAALAS